MKTRRRSHKRWKSIHWFELGACPIKKYNITRKKSQNRNISPIRGEAPAELIEMKICIGVDLGDIIMDVKFMFEKISGILMSFGGGGQNSPFPIWLCTWGNATCDNMLLLFSLIERKLMKARESIMRIFMSMDSAAECPALMKVTWLTKYQHKDYYRLDWYRLNVYFRLKCPENARICGNPWYKIVVNQCRFNVHKIFFSERVAVAWNSLPPSVVNFTSLRTLRRTIVNAKLKLFTKY